MRGIKKVKGDELLWNNFISQVERKFRINGAETSNAMALKRLDDPFILAISMNSSGSELKTDVFDVHVFFQEF